MIEFVKFKYKLPLFKELKKGDTVYVKHDIVCFDYYNGCRCNNIMWDYRGMSITIEEVFDDYIYAAHWFWGKDMLEVEND